MVTMIHDKGLTYKSKHKILDYRQQSCNSEVYIASCKSHKVDYHCMAGAGAGAGADAECFMIVWWRFSLSAPTIFSTILPSFKNRKVGIASTSHSAATAYTPHKLINQCYQNFQNIGISTRKSY